MEALHEPPSLSKSALLLSPCLAWANPQAKHYDEKYVEGDKLSKRDKGTLFHKLVDLDYRGLYRDAELWEAPDDVKAWLAHADTYIDRVLGPRCDTIQSEMAISVNWATGEAEIQQGVKDRKYLRKHGWQNGTADLVCILKDGSLLIADWKTGGNDGATEQLLSLGAAFQKCMPRNPLTNELRQLYTLCLQVNEDGVWPRESLWTQQSVVSHWDSMRFKWEDVVSGNTGTPVPGIHCTALYCPHLAYCTAIQAATVGLAERDEKGCGLVAANDLVQRLRVTGSPTSNEEAGFTAAILSAVKRQQKYLEAKLKEYIATGGRVTQGGYVWADGGNGYRWRKS